MHRQVKYFSQIAQLENRGTGVFLPIETMLQFVALCFYFCKLS